MARTIRKMPELLDFLNDDDLDLEIEAAGNREYYEQRRREAEIWKRRRASGSPPPNP
jgi:hypothetical protein